jgi:hypothetical protein
MRRCLFGNRFIAATRQSMCSCSTLRWLRWLLASRQLSNLLKGIENFTSLPRSTDFPTETGLSNDACRTASAALSAALPQ